MRRLLLHLKTFFCLYIYYPIKGWWNYYIYNDYIIDNIRNRALMDYCEKIIMDEEYQPQGAYEHLFEDKLTECFNAVQNFLRESNPDIELNYQDERVYCVKEIYKLLLQKAWVVED